MILILAYLQFVQLSLMRTALLAGGLGVVTLIGALFAYNKTRRVEVIPRQKIIQTAKLLRQKMYLSLVQIACFVKQNYRKVPPEQLKTYILQEQSQFMKEIKKQLSEIFTEYTEDEFRQNIEKYYKNDVEIQYHLKLYQQEFDKALLGVTPQIKQQVITFLTPQKIIKIIGQLLDAKMKRITSSITEKVTFQQMVIILRTQKQQQKNLRSSKLKQMGLIGKDEQLAQIFEFLVAKYSRMDVQFRSKYQQITQQYQRKANQYVDRFCSFPRATSKKNIS